MGRKCAINSRVPSLIVALAGRLAAAAALCLAVPALAQTTTYSNATASTVGGVNETDTPCAAPLVRNFTVGTSYTVSDVDIAALIAHTWRGDLVMTLQAPSGLRVTFNNGVGGGADNYNVTANDEAASPLSGHTTDDIAAGAGSAPPYQRDFSPTSPLSAFDGQNSLGTWRLEICDNAAQDVGTFYRADLYLTQAAANADLSLTKTVSNATPASGASISYTLTVSSAGASTGTATGVTVSDALPLGFAFVSASGTGSYNAGAGVWTVGSLAPGASAAITITGTVTASAGATVTNTAEVLTSSLVDPDSTVGNGSTTEDDDAQRPFTVSGARVAGTPPALTCPLTTLHDWDAITWTAGSTSNSYAISTIGSVTWAITNQGAWQTDAARGGLSPAEQTVMTGGFPAGQQSLFLHTNMPNRTAIAQTTIILPTAVPGAQFRLFDVDFGSGSFADQVTVTGSFSGSAVTPTLTNGVANYVIGNSAYGDGSSGDTSGNGNVVVTFLAPVDTIVITYGNHSTAPANPGNQGITIADITFCRPVANVTLAKTSSIVSDPVNGTTDPKFIPGATVRYCLLATNAGSATTTAIAITDSLPATVTFVPGSMTSATDCSAAGTPEDDNASGGDESDPFGMQISGTTVGGTASSIGPSSSFAMRFNATVN
jgi:uncharacterized repeat protein (TIGR01451 family)